MRSLARKGDAGRMQIIDIAELRRSTGWSPVRRELGITAFGVNGYSADAGNTIIGAHTEEQSGQEELYVVLEGKARVMLGDEEREVGPGTLVFAQPGQKREITSLADGTTVLVVGAQPGVAYEARVGEISLEVIALFAEDRIAEAKELLESSLEPFDHHWVLYYNLACAEARLGETEPAFAHLRTAIDKRPQAVDNAKDDPDLESLRTDARFDELLGAATPG